MTYSPTQTGFMNLEDSARLLHVIFPNYPSLEPRYPAPLLEPIPGGSANLEARHTAPCPESTDRSN